MVSFLFAHHWVSGLKGLNESVTLCQQKLIAYAFGRDVLYGAVPGMYPSGTD